MNKTHIKKERKRPLEQDSCKKRPKKITKYYKLFFECSDVCGLVLDFVGYKEFHLSMILWQLSFGFKQASNLRLKIPVGYTRAYIWSNRLGGQLSNLEKVIFTCVQLQSTITVGNIDLLKHSFPKLNTIIIRNLPTEGKQVKIILHFIKQHGLKLMAMKNKENILITELINPFFEKEGEPIKIYDGVLMY